MKCFYGLLWFTFLVSNDYVILKNALIDLTADWGEKSFVIEGSFNKRLFLKKFENSWKQEINAPLRKPLDYYLHDIGYENLLDIHAPAIITVKEFAQRVARELEVNK